MSQAETRYQTFHDKQQEHSFSPNHRRDVLQVEIYCPECNEPLYDTKPTPGNWLTCGKCSDIYEWHPELEKVPDDERNELIGEGIRSTLQLYLRSAASRDYMAPIFDELWERYQEYKRDAE